MPHASRSTTLSWHPARSAQGLDSATTYSVVNSLHELVGALQMSCVISLLQVGSRQDSDSDAATPVSAWVDFQGHARFAPTCWFTQLHPGVVDGAR